MTKLNLLLTLTKKNYPHCGLAQLILWQIPRKFSPNRRQSDNRHRTKYRRVTVAKPPPISLMDHPSPHGCQNFSNFSFASSFTCIFCEHINLLLVSINSTLSYWRFEFDPIVRQYVHTAVQRATRCGERWRIREEYKVRSWRLQATKVLINIRSIIFIQVFLLLFILM